MPSYHVLYAGDDDALPVLLKDALHSHNYFVVRSPIATARTLIRSGIEYSLLLFDDDSRGAELEAYARTLGHRESTPVMLIKQGENIRSLAGRIRHVISENDSADP